MTREDVINVLKQRAYTVKDLCNALNKSTGAIESDLEHIRTSIRTDPDYMLVMNPAQCELCGFKFSNDKIKAPTRCPKCNKEKILPPSFKIIKRT